VILSHELRHGVPMAQLRMARPDSGQADLVDSVTELNRGVEPHRTVHPIEDGLILRPGVRGRIKRA
jgi:hypothetical protein